MICIHAEVVTWIRHIVRDQGNTGKGGEVGWVVALPLYSSCQYGCLGMKDGVRERTALHNRSICA